MYNFENKQKGTYGLVRIIELLRFLHSNLPKSTKRAIRFVRTDGPTLIIEKLCFEQGQQIQDT